MKKKIIILSIIFLSIVIGSFTIWKVIISLQLKKAKQVARAAGIVVDKTDALKFLKNINVPQNNSPQTKKLRNALMAFNKIQTYSNYISQQELNDAKLPYKIVWEWQNTTTKKEVAVGIIISKNELNNIEVQPSIEFINEYNPLLDDEPDELINEYDPLLDDEPDELINEYDPLLDDEPDESNNNTKVVIQNFKYKGKTSKNLYLKDNDKLYQLKNSSIVTNNQQNEEEKNRLHQFLLALTTEDCIAIDNSFIHTPLTKGQRFILSRTYTNYQKSFNNIAELLAKQDSLYLMTTKEIMTPNSLLQISIPISKYIKNIGNIARYFADRGNKESSLKYLFTIKQSIIKTTNEPIDICFFVKRRTLIIYKNALELSLARLSLSHEQLQQLQINTTNLNLSTLMGNIIKFDPYNNVRIIGADIRNGIPFIATSNNDLFPKLATKFMHISGFFDLNCITYYNDHKNIKINCKTVIKVDKKLHLTGILFRWCTCLTNRQIKILKEGVAYQNCLNCALAVERYRLQYEDFPRELKEIVPQFINEIPQDPFGNGKIKYLIKDKAVIIYSIGKSQTDEQGNYNTNQSNISFRLLKTKLKPEKEKKR